MRHGETRVLKVAGDGHCPAPRGALVGMEGGSDGAAASGRRQAPAQQAARERRAQWQTGPHGSAVASAALPALSPPLGQVWRWREMEMESDMGAQGTAELRSRVADGRRPSSGPRHAGCIRTFCIVRSCHVCCPMVTYLYHRPDIIIISASTG